MWIAEADALAQLGTTLGPKVGWRPTRLARIAAGHADAAPRTLLGVRWLWILLGELAVLAGLAAAVAVMLSARIGSIPADVFGVAIFAVGALLALRMARAERDHARRN